MGVLRDRIAYRRANKANAAYMAAVRNHFGDFGDLLERIFEDSNYHGDPREIGEFKRCVVLMLTDLESASRHAIKACLLQSGAPIDKNPGELHYRAPETES